LHFKNRPFFFPALQIQRRVPEKGCARKSGLLLPLQQPMAVKFSQLVF